MDRDAYTRMHWTLARCRDADTTRAVGAMHCALLLVLDRSIQDVLVCSCTHRPMLLCHGRRFCTMTTGNGHHCRVHATRNQDAKYS